MAKKGRTPATDDAARWLDEQYRKDPGMKRRVTALVDEMLITQDLVALRAERGVSQRQLAELAGMKQPIEIATRPTGGRWCAAWQLDPHVFSHLRSGRRARRARVGGAGAAVSGRGTGGGCDRRCGSPRRSLRSD